MQEPLEESISKLKTFRLDRISKLPAVAVCKDAPFLAWQGRLTFAILVLFFYNPATSGCVCAHYLCSYVD